MSNLKPPVHPDIKKQLFAAAGSTAEVAAAAAHLSDLMADIHGGKWRVQIEHEADAAFVLIVPRHPKHGGL